MEILINHELDLEKGNPVGKQEHKATGLQSQPGCQGRGRRTGAGGTAVCYYEFENALRVIGGRFALRRGGDAGGENGGLRV